MVNSSGKHEAVPAVYLAGGGTGLWHPVAHILAPGRMESTVEGETAASELWERAKWGVQNPDQQPCTIRF